jgi:hypothetical protein
MKTEFEKLKKMDLHFNFCNDSVAKSVSLENDHYSIKKNIAQYYNEQCQEISNEYPKLNLNTKSSQKILLIREKPFPYRKILVPGLAVIVVGAIGLNGAISYHNKVKNKQYDHSDWGWGTVNFVEQEIAVTCIAVSCVVEAIGFGLTTFGLIKYNQIKKKKNFLNNIKVEKNQLLIDY